MCIYIYIYICCIYIYISLYIGLYRGDIGDMWGLYRVVWGVFF